jgi:hypothetical protein
MRKLILAATAAATLVTPAIASANLNAHGPAKVPVHACVAKHGHKARLAKHCTRMERGITIWLKAIAGPQGPRGVQGPAGTNGTTATNGTTSTVGTESIGGVNGVNGVNGATGPQGPAGVSSPWTYSYTGGYAGDTNVVYNEVWANDKFNTTFWVIPQADGSYLIEKSITGTFETVKGAHSPNGSAALNGVLQKGGVTGTISGVETWVAHGNFDPTATPDLNRMQGNESQNDAFTKAFFGDNGYYSRGGVGNNYDFVYHAGSQTMVQSGNGYTNDIAG